MHCPICGCTYSTDAVLPRRNNYGDIIYDFSALNVGDSVTIPRAQTAVASRIGAYRRSKRYPERATHRFTTKRIDANTTIVWRTA